MPEAASAPATTPRAVASRSGELLKPLLGILAFAALGGSGSALLHPAAPSFSQAVHDAGALELRAARAVDGALWIDAREAAEFDAGHLEGAVLLNETDWDGLLPKFLERWSPGMPVIVYCGSDACPAARMVRARLLRELGLQPDEVSFLKGGLQAWPDATLVR